MGGSDERERGKTNEHDLHFNESGPNTDFKTSEPDAEMG